MEFPSYFMVAFVIVRVVLDTLGLIMGVRWRTPAVPGSLIAVG